uniref:Uncharacterized protein n=1 Tax=Nomascus leucogenys TaxID=61853 RepID=A0A2I3FRW9_NOMLE
MALWALTCALHSLSLAPPTVATPVPSLFPASQVMNNALFQWPSALMLLPCHQILTSMALSANFVHTKYTIKPVKMRKSGGEDHTGQIWVHGIGRGPFEEKVIQIHCDPCRSADIGLVAGGSQKHWIIATENIQAGDTILNSNHIGQMAEGDAYPLGALPVGTLINNMESEPGRAAEKCGVLLWKVNGTAIIQLPSKRQMQVLETLSNTDHNKQVTGRAGHNRWLGKRPSSGLWHCKGCWAGRKIWPLPFMKSYVKLPSDAAQS